MKPLFSVLLLTSFLFMAAACTVSSGHPEPRIEGGTAVIDTTQLIDSMPRFFTLKTDKEPVSFFVVRTGKTVVSYVDACKRCYVKGKGYRAEGEGVVCNSCDVRYPIEELQGIGSCHPIQLTGRLEGNRYRIELADLRDACQWFR